MMATLYFERKKDKQYTLSGNNLRRKRRWVEAYPEKFDGGGGKKTEINIRTQEKQWFLASQGKYISRKQ